MEPKKNARVDLERWRTVFFEAGLTVALATVAVVFSLNLEWRPVEVIDFRAMNMGQEAVDVAWQEQLGLRPLEVLPAVAVQMRDVAEERSDEIRAVADEVVVRPVEEDIAASFTLAEPPTSEARRAMEAVRAATEDSSGNPASEAAIVDEVPRFMGGDPAETFRRWVLARLSYPSAAASRGAYGVVAVAFIIETDGALSAFETIYSADPALAAEALRVVRMSPPWEPARRGGNSIRMRYIQPIEFGLARK